MMHDAEHLPGRHAQPEFRPGFRLNVLDCILIGAGAIAAYFAITLKSLPATIPAYVIFTFFLYCNVFRIRRTPEFIWAGVFTILALTSFYFGQPSWLVVFAVGVALSMILIAIAMRHPSYHGIFWRSLNPRLPAWWDQHHGQKPSSLHKQ
jgi:hypothetical protein